MWPAWYAARLMCSMSAALVGGIDVKSLSPLQKRSLRALSTEKQVDSPPYRITVYLSKAEIRSESKSPFSSNCRGLLKDRKACVVWVSSSFHADQADGFPLDEKKDTESHPVKAWNPRRASALTGPETGE